MQTRELEKIKMPDPVELIIGRLNRGGFEAYAVGGCVRDTILGRTPGDWDITTNARPEDVKRIFDRTIDTGIQHGTVTVLIGRQGYEVTTYRIDGAYEDGRHPKSVSFTPELEEDLRRRDFTINAMAYNHEQGIVDLFDGMGDLKRGVIRCVGDPMERFTEDALRILRAVRFSAQLGFQVEEKTYEAIASIAPKLLCVSKERIQAELTKLLLSENPQRIGMVYDRGMGPYISQSFARAACADVNIPSALPAQKHIRWAAFLRRSDGDLAGRVLKDLRMDNDTIKKVVILNQWLKRELQPNKVCIRKTMSRMDGNLYEDLLEMKAILSQAETDRSAEDLVTIAELSAQIRQDGDCVGLRQLAVTGRDIIAAGAKPGKAVGDLLDCLLDTVLERPEYNNREYLFELTKKLLKTKKNSCNT